MRTATRYVAIIHYLDVMGERRKYTIDSETHEKAQEFVEVGIKRGYFRHWRGHDDIEYILTHRILSIEIENWQESVGD